MFIGHFGVGLAAKKVTPAVSLGTLFLSAQFLDLLWPSLLLLGVEHVAIDPGNTKLTPLNFVSYPYSHSLIMVCIWGTLLGGAHWIVKREVKAAIIIGGLVVSHWVLDLLVHRPDLPLHLGESPLFGFGLWNSIFGTLLLEGGIFISGVILYLRATKANNRSGLIGFWALIGFLLLIYAGNVLGPPPPDTGAIAWIGQLQWLFVLWAYWVDKNRTAS